MATTVTPRSRATRMHRTEKLGRALDAGAVGFIWMRGLPGGLPETGAAQIGRFCEIPAIGVSYEDGYALQRLAARGPAVVAIHSTNENRTVSTQNVVAEFRGRAHPDELIVAWGALRRARHRPGRHGQRGRSGGVDGGGARPSPVPVPVPAHPAICHLCRRGVGAPRLARIRRAARRGADPVHAEPGRGRPQPDRAAVRHGARVPSGPWSL